MTHRWLKFWPQDWQRDPALRSCSAAARGIWMDILCIMHDGAPYGHLTINDKAASTKQIASICGVSDRDAIKLLRELEEGGVFSRTGDGIIFSRRMVRDKAISERGKAFGKEGGNPILKAHKLKLVNGGGNGGGIKKEVNPPPNPPLKRGPNLQEYRVQEKEKEKKDSELRSGAFAPLDPRTELWRNGPVVLERLTGKPARSTKPLIGKWLKAMGDNCSGLLNVLREAEQIRPIDPLSWIVAAVEHRREGKPTAMDALRTEWNLPPLQWHNPPEDDTKAQPQDRMLLQ